MGNIDPTLGSKFPTEFIMYIVRLIHFCVQAKHVRHIFGVPQRTMTYVINEINVALQLEECLKAGEGAMKSEIPQHASCGSLETLEEMKWPTRFNEKSTSDCSEIKQKLSSVELVDINPKGERRQQPQRILTQSHDSRSVFQIVLMFHLMQEMTRGLSVNDLCCGIV